MGFKIKKTVNGETVWEPIKAKKYTASKITEHTGALPITINANGQPLLDYRIYGNTEQTGTPTPENPIIPSGCGEKTENLIEGYLEGYHLVNGTQGIVPTTSFKEAYAPIIQGESYYISTSDASGQAIWGYFYNAPSAGDKPYDEQTHVAIDPRQRTFVAPITGYVAFRVNRTYERAMLNSGSTALPYEPYGYKLPLTSAGQGVDIYLGESQTTRRIKKLVLTGKETSWSILSTYYTVLASNVKPWNECICTHCAYQGVIGDNNSMRLWIRQAYFPDYPTLAGFKSFLAAQYAAGTPVTIWYVLAEPETGIVNEPLMKIGDYADTVSMEQAGVSIPTAAGSTVIDYDGTSKPSQMYVKYNSWSGWSDINNYKMVNGDWTQETT